ncbi:unnamed protein product, partial [Lepeophtheirus salmonis]
MVVTLERKKEDDDDRQTDRQTDIEREILCAKRQRHLLLPSIDAGHLVLGNLLNTRETPKKDKNSRNWLSNIHSSPLAYDCDKNSRKNLPVDTGTEIRLIPANTPMDKEPSFFLKAEWVHPFQGMHQTYLNHSLGQFFLRAFDLLSDFLRCILVKASDFTSGPCKTSNKSDSAHLDDILISSSSKEQHLKHLTTTFQRLHHHELGINLAKSKNGAIKIHFLSHSGKSSGITPLANKVKLSQSYQFSVQQEFIGALPTKASHSKFSIEPNMELKESFNRAKSALDNATFLVHPIRDAPLALSVDASDTAI